MIILSDSNNNVVGSYLDGTRVTNLTGVINLPTPEQQIGMNAVLVINPTTNALSYNYVARPLTQEEQLAQTEQQNAQILLSLVQGGLM